MYSRLFSLTILSMIPLLMGGGSDSQVLYSDDGECSITIPEGWKVADLNSVAILQASYGLKEHYIIVIRDRKTDLSNTTLEEFSDLTVSTLTNSIDDPEVKRLVDTKIGGHPAIQKEVRGKYSTFDIVYIHTAVESEDNYYQILAWTLADRWRQSEDVLHEVTNSFREGETDYLEGIGKQGDGKNDAADRRL